MKIAITGGHPTPALAVADRIRELYGNAAQVIWMGRRYANDREKLDTFEYQEVKARHLPFYSVQTGRGWKGIFKTLSALPSIWHYLGSQKPDYVLSFGGYIALPVGICAWMRGVPLYTHEQVLIPGTTSKILSRIARQTFISFPQSAKYFPHGKTLLTGNPIRQDFLKTASQPVPKHEPTIYVFGGHIGAHAINEYIFTILDELLEHYTIHHQVGNISEYGDLDRAHELHKGLPDDLKTRYKPFAHALGTDHARYMHEADLCICRAGANTIFELVVMRKPAILVPLPVSAKGEQQAQAEVLTAAQAASTFPQGRSVVDLSDMIKSMFADLPSYEKSYEKIAYLVDTDAADKIASQFTT